MVSPLLAQCGRVRAPVEREAIALGPPPGPEPLARQLASATATATAQPGSPAWPQSPKRHISASSSMSPNARSAARPMSCGRTPRRPGVSIRTPPPASRCNSRCVVVWRPLPSRRTSAVAATSSPTRAFTSVLLPAPERPSRTAVEPASRARRLVEAEPRCATLSASTGAPRAAPRPRPPRRRGRGGIGLREHDERHRTALPGEQEEALQAPWRERVVERVRDDDDVDVRGDDGRRARVLGMRRSSSVRRSSRVAIRQSSSMTTQSPTASSNNRSPAAPRACGAQAGRPRSTRTTRAAAVGSWPSSDELGVTALIPDELGKRHGHVIQRGSPTG